MMRGQARQRRIRVRKEDSAYIYALLESYEGISSYSTLAHPPGAPYRDLELQIPESFVQEVDDLLKRLGELVYDLDPR